MENRRPVTTSASLYTGESYRQLEKARSQRVFESRGDGNIESYSVVGILFSLPAFYLSTLYPCPFVFLLEFILCIMYIA